jgi:cytochrome P450
MSSEELIGGCMTDWTNPMMIVSRDPTVVPRTFADAAKKYAAHRDEMTGLWMVLRSADILNGLRSPDVFSTRLYKAGLMHPSLTTLEGDARLNWKRVVLQVLGPRNLELYEKDYILPAIDRVIDRLRNRKSFDMIPDFAMQVPREVIGALFSIDPADYEKNEAYIKAIMQTFVGAHDPKVMEEGFVAKKLFVEQMRGVIERELVNPGENLLGSIVRETKAQGLFDQTTAENIIVTLIVAGYDTTVWMLAATTAAFLLNDGIYDKIRNDQTLIGPAIEESLRWACPSTGAFRFVERDVELEGVTIPAGNIAFLSYMAHHYDATVFPEPEVYKLDRRPNHIGFSYGAHYCVGASLARLEARIGLSRLLDTFSSLTLDPERKPTFMVGTHGSPMFGPDALWVDAKRGD